MKFIEWQIYLIELCENIIFIEIFAWRYHLFVEIMRKVIIFRWKLCVKISFFVENYTWNHHFSLKIIRDDIFHWKLTMSLYDGIFCSKMQDLFILFWTIQHFFTSFLNNTIFLYIIFSNILKYTIFLYIIFQIFWITQYFFISFLKIFELHNISLYHFLKIFKLCKIIFGIFRLRNVSLYHFQ